MVKRGAAKAATTPVQKSRGVTEDMAASTEKIPKPVATAKAAMEKAGAEITGGNLKSYLTKKDWDA
eukprot:6119078-Pyramimonas_sp.AAC.1